MLQILDDGRVTDAQGRVVNFENTVIVMTTNAGSNRSGALGFSTDGTSLAENATHKALTEFLRPEFLNRVDDIIVFSQLSEEEIGKIALIMLENLKKRLLQNDIEAEIDESAVKLLAKEGFDPVYGARPLRRAITAKVEDLFAEEMLEGRIENGDKVIIKAVDGEITIQKQTS
jgi:ATP-dependent Clp protease ATP-binding subunit ClpC